MSPCSQAFDHPLAGRGQDARAGGVAGHVGGDHIGRCVDEEVEAGVGLAERDRAEGRIARVLDGEDGSRAVQGGGFGVEHIDPIADCEVIHDALEIGERRLAEIQLARTAEAVEGDCRVSVAVPTVLSNSGRTPTCRRYGMPCCRRHCLCSPLS